MKRVLPLLVVLILAQPAFAALPADAGEKYRLHVVLRCGAHNWLGDQFRHDLKNDLGGILQDALGGMGDVKVVDLKKIPPPDLDPFLRDFQSRGFAALDVARDLTGTKTHFLQVDFTNGYYELQARQHDGLTGFVSALRRDRTADRALVTRLASQMIAQDFGAIGTVTGKGEDVDGQGDVTVSFRGGSLTPNLDRWAHKNDVFAVYRIDRVDEKKDRGAPVENALVQIMDDPKGGSATGRIIFRRDPNPLKMPATGIRCIRVATATGPLRLRLVDENKQPHKGTLQIRIHSEKFQKGISPQEEVLEADKTGLYLSKNIYRNVAFVRVVTGSQAIARIPVEILDDRPVIVSVGVSAEQETRGQLVYKRGELKRMYDESEYVHLRSASAEINALIRQGKNKEALERGMRSRDALDDDIKRLSNQLEDLKKEIGSLPISVADCEVVAKKLANRKTDINQRIGELDEVIRRANDPAVLARQKKLEESYAKALALIESNDYDSAITELTAIIKEFGEDPNVRKRLDSLETAWKSDGPEQKAARDYFYKDWIAAKTVADIETKLPTAKQRLQTLIQKNDALALLKVRSSLLDLGKIVRDEAQALSQNPEDNKDKIEKIKKLIEELDKFGQSVETALQKK